jgi:hypothetical protein
MVAGRRAFSSSPFVIYHDWYLIIYSFNLLCFLSRSGTLRCMRVVKEGAHENHKRLGKE